MSTSYAIPKVPGGWTMEDVWWPRIPFLERLQMCFGLEEDKKFGASYRQAMWVGRRIEQSCRASRLHPPGRPERLPHIEVFVPADERVDEYAYCLVPPPGVRVSRFNAAFLQDVNARLGGYKATLHINHTGVWLLVPVETQPSKPPSCTLDDLGAPHAGHVLPLPLGMSTRGPLWADLAQAPHALFAGASGSGKSTLIHACLHYLLARAEVWAVDLKLVELSRYKARVARLATEPDEVAPLFAALFVETRRRLAEMQQRNQNEWRGQRIVLVVDELAEVTLASKDDTQTLLRLAQIGRAAGVHLLLATQRPSVQIIPGDLKANIPLRVALALPTGVDSRVVLDAEGAELLTPPGDALALQGHQLIRVSTPNYKAPIPELDTGAEDDLRLVGLAPDARAAFLAIEGGCKPTKRGVMAHFHWGTERARRALRQLRMVDLLAAQGKGEESSAGEAEAHGVNAGATGAGTGGPGGTTPSNTTFQNTRSGKRGTESTTGVAPNPVPTQATRDVEAVARAIESGACKATRRSVEQHFHWGTRRALAALRMLRNP